MSKSTTSSSVEKMPPAFQAMVVEALLFSSEGPLTAAKMREIVPDLTDGKIREIVNQLNEAYETSGRAFRIQEVAGGYQMFTLPEFAPYIEQLFQSRQKSKLSQKALETLAIIAYKQPITRQEIEDIRGVNSDGIIRTLLARGLITIAGRAEAPGSPFLYKTTKTFLEYFGLKSLKDLPKLKEIDELIAADEEIQERFGDHLLKEIHPEVLGMKENGGEYHNHEQEDESSE